MSFIYFYKHVFTCIYENWKKTFNPNCEYHYTSGIHVILYQNSNGCAILLIFNHTRLNLNWFWLEWWNVQMNNNFTLETMMFDCNMVCKLTEQFNSVASRLKIKHKCCWYFCFIICLYTKYRDPLIFNRDTIIFFQLAQFHHSHLTTC